MICVGIRGVIFLEMESVYDLALFGKGSWSFRALDMGPLLGKDATWGQSIRSGEQTLRLALFCQPDRGAGMGEDHKTECD